MPRLRLLSAAVLGWLVAAALSPAYAQAPAEGVVKDTAEQMLAALDAGGPELAKDRRRVHALIEELLVPHVDFDRMSRWVLGKHWRRASMEQREQFIREFQTLLVRTYAAALMEYKNHSINYLPARSEPGAAEVTVRTEVHPAKGFPIPVHYDLHLKNGRWMVYDLTIDGISLITNFRTAFTSEIRRHGSLAALINKLAARNQQARK